MSTVECNQHAPTSRLSSLRCLSLQHGSSIAWLVSAAVVMLAASVCATMPIRESIFDATQLRLLVAALSSIVATNILLAFNVREGKWHIGSWIAVVTGWYLVLFLT